MLFVTKKTAPGSLLRTSHPAPGEPISLPPAPAHTRARSESAHRFSNREFPQQEAPQLFSTVESGLAWDIEANPSFRTPHAHLRDRDRLRKPVHACSARP